MKGKKPKDHTGLKYNRLTAIKYTHNGKRGRHWDFQCECGTTKNIYLYDVVTGQSKSCGCLAIEQYKRDLCPEKNWWAKTLAYGSWNHMKDRCLNKNSDCYHNYGGRGIKIYGPWAKDFLAFYNYIGERPSKDHSIDRYPNKDGDYEPDNVRWATRAEQNRNHRRNVFITYKGRTMVLKDWATELGINNMTLYHALKKYSMEDYLNNHKKIKVII